MGIETGLGILLNEIRQEWGISYIQQSLVSVCTMIGVFIGSYFWGLLADKRGRKPAFNKLLFFIVLGLFIGILSPNVYMLAPCYIIAGFGIGGSFTVDGNVFLEYCPLDKQYLLTTISVLSSVGASLPPALALFYEGVNAPYQWRFVQGTLGLIALAVAIPRFWIKETPSFLVSKHKTTQIVDLLEDINPGPIDRESLYEQVVSASPKVILSEKTFKVQLMALFRKPLRKYTLLYIFIWGLTSFTFIGVTSFLPVILIRTGYGESDSDIYEMMLYQELGIFYLAGIPGVMLGTYLVKSKIGRKGTLIGSQCLAVMLFFGFLIENYWALLFLSLGYFFFENMFYAVMFCITPETFPPEIRNTAIGLFSSANTVASVISPVVAGVVLEYTGGNFVFVLIFAAAISIVAFCALWVIETRDYSPSSLGPINYE